MPVPQQECEECRGQVSSLYQRRTDKKMVCFACLPAEQVAKYPGWAEREALHARRAAQFTMNVGGKNTELV